MFQIDNPSRLKAALLPFFDQHGEEMLTAVVKGTFSLPRAGERVQLADEQLPPFNAHVYVGDPGASSIKYPADLTPPKACTDVLLWGSARSPEGRRTRELEVTVRVGPLQKRILVFGDRRWQRSAINTSPAISDPEPFVEMPIVYERAFGGSDEQARGNAHHWDGRNPIGIGFLENPNAIDDTWLPNVEDPDYLIRAWNDRPPIAGFGAIDESWAPRAQLSGTYDEDWAASHAPLLPVDVDPMFFNVAPDGLVADGFLEGGDPVELTNVSHEGRLVFRLPDLSVTLTSELGGALTEHDTRLWTVLFDPDADRFCMVWGTAFPIGKQPSRMRRIAVDINGSMANQLMVPA